VVSVTEGPYTIQKHPYIFMDANVIAINKIDLAEAMNINVEELIKDAKKINFNCEVVVTSAKTGEGIEKLIKALKI